MKNLFEFLRKHRAITKFKNNFKKLSYSLYSLKKYCDLVLPEGYIIGSFCWDKTDEGHDFWENLDNKWQATL